MLHFKFWVYLHTCIYASSIRSFGLLVLLPNYICSANLEKITGRHEVKPCCKALHVGLPITAFHKLWIQMNWSEKGKDQPGHADRTYQGVLTQKVGSVSQWTLASAEAVQYRSQTCLFWSFSRPPPTPTLSALTRLCNSILTQDLITILISRGLRMNNPSSYGFGRANS